jgi:hypothetical protein
MQYISTVSVQGGECQFIRYQKWTGKSIDLLATPDRCFFFWEKSGFCMKNPTLSKGGVVVFAQLTLVQTRPSAMSCFKAASTASGLLRINTSAGYHLLSRECGVMYQLSISRAVSNVLSD